MFEMCLFGLRLRGLWGGDLEIKKKKKQCLHVMLWALVPWKSHGKEFKKFPLYQPFTCCTFDFFKRKHLYHFKRVDADKQCNASYSRLPPPFFFQMNFLTVGLLLRGEGALWKGTTQTPACMEFTGLLKRTTPNSSGK